MMIKTMMMIQISVHGDWGLFKNELEIRGNWWVLLARYRLFNHSIDSYKLFHFQEICSPYQELHTGEIKLLSVSASCQVQHRNFSHRFRSCLVRKNMWNMSCKMRRNHQWCDISEDTTMLQLSNIVSNARWMFHPIKITQFHGGRHYPEVESPITKESSIATPPPRLQAFLNSNPIQCQTSTWGPPARPWEVGSIARLRESGSMRM